MKTPASFILAAFFVLLGFNTGTDQLASDSTTGKILDSNAQFRHQRSELMKSSRMPANARVINTIEKMPPMAYR